MKKWIIPAVLLLLSSCNNNTQPRNEIACFRIDGSQDRCFCCNALLIGAEPQCVKFTADMTSVFTEACSVMQNGGFVVKESMR